MPPNQKVNKAEGTMPSLNKLGLYEGETFVGMYYNFIWFNSTGAMTTFIMTFSVTNDIEHYFKT